MSIMFNQTKFMIGEVMDITDFMKLELEDVNYSGIVFCFRTTPDILELVTEKTFKRLETR